ncbi:MAG: carboxylesterase family protein, partial [Clostridia bacterium]|nr:carboxylesterase family protein [Clostridia bacterium]
TQDEMFGAWINFARSGDPNHDKLVEWRPYTADDHACMVFGAPSECLVDHDNQWIELSKR